MSLLDRLGALLSGRGIAHALIGATALAAHGISRSTMDQDLLVCDRRVSDPSFWLTLSPPTTVDVRRGDAEDPLAGGIRIHEPGERDVDIVVGLSDWQHAILALTRTEFLVFGRIRGIVGKKIVAPDLGPESADPCDRRP